MSQPTLYDRILELIDEELDRLLQARAILIDYAHDAAPVPRRPKPGRKRQRRQPTVKEVPAPEVQVTILPPAPERKRRPRAVKSPQPEPRALASRIPSAPVLVAPPKDFQPNVQPPSTAQYSSDFGALISAAERSLERSQS